MIVYTRRLPPTDTQGTRISARTADGSRQTTIAYPYEARDPHVAAVKALLGSHVEPVHQRETPTGHRYYVPDSQLTG